MNFFVFIGTERRLEGYFEYNSSAEYNFDVIFQMLVNLLLIYINRLLIYITLQFRGSMLHIVVAGIWSIAVEFISLLALKMLRLYHNLMNTMQERQTLLLEAARSGDQEVVSLLIQTGAGVDAVDSTDTVAGSSKVRGPGCGVTTDTDWSWVMLWTLLSVLATDTVAGSRKVRGPGCGVTTDTDWSWVDAVDCDYYMNIHTDSTIFLEQTCLSTRSGTRKWFTTVQTGAGVDARQTLLLEAARSGDREVVSLLIQTGAGVDAVDCDYYMNRQTLLLVAGRSGDQGVVSLLIQTGAVVDALLSVLETDIVAGSSKVRGPGCGVTTDTDWSCGRCCGL
ncbi:hypothetical protein J6590_076729 [Homalodisca vitripennis]|nr:hypothetical protein J6590_076729 [Homalodisca vitripennis]